MLDYPKTVLEFRVQFHSEAACRDYWVGWRWPQGFVCPRGQGPDAWRTARGLFFCRACQHQASVRAGALFADTNLPWRLWCEAIWHVTNQQ